MSSLKRFIKQDVVEPALMDLRSYVRPYAKNLRGMGIAKYNDLHRVLGTGRRKQEPLRQQWQRVLGNSADLLGSLPEPSGQKILFATGYGLAGAMMALESVLAMSLRVRGANPVVLRCDKVLPACEWNRFGNFDPAPGEFGPRVTERTRLEICRICTEGIEATHGLLPIPGLGFSDVQRADDLPRITRMVDELSYEQYGGFVYKGIQVGEHAFSSTMRALHRGTLDAEDPETCWLFRRYLIASCMIVDLTERVFARERPDCVVAMHGIYVTHGTICEVARRDGIRVVVYGHPYRKGCVWLSHDETYHRALVTEPNEHWEDLDLDGEAGRVIDEYLNSRRFGTRDYVCYNTDAIEDRETIIRELGLDPDRPIVSLYTNVLWDAQLYYNFTAFDNMLEWLFESIRYFRTRPDLQLVVRVHPAEVTAAMVSKQPILAEIQREFPELPENVKIIPPESKLSSYTLAEISHASLIYGTKMGVEIAAIGTPVILAGESFHRGKGYTYDVESREEYFALLDRVADLEQNSPEMMERARKYAYHYFFRVMIDFPLYSVADGLHFQGPQLEFERLDALAPGRYESLDLICEGILDGETPFFYEGSEAVHVSHA